MAGAGSDIFKVDDLEELLPPAAFLEGSGSLDAALDAAAGVLASLGSDSHSLDDVREALRRLLLSRPDVVPEPLALLRTIRRWALQGLRDDRALLDDVLLAAPLESPELSDPTAASASFPHSQKASRVATAAQARDLLANAFLGNCRDIVAKHKDPWNRGGLDFTRLLMDNPPHRSSLGQARLQCLLAYFETRRQVEGTEDDDRKIAFERVRFVPLDPNKIEDFGRRLPDGLPAAGRYVGQGVRIHDSPMEEPLVNSDTAPSSIAFVNFANANYGYGKFIASCTQEEILLSCCPELAVGMAFLGKMYPDEVVNVRNVRRYAKYSGYLGTFRCEGPVSASFTTSPLQTVLTMDACTSAHFTRSGVARDLSKAYYAFREHVRTSTSTPVAVSTGKWGCGVFGGVSAHKFLQQILAAHLAGVDELAFSRFGSDEGCSELLVALEGSQATSADVFALLRACTDRRNFVRDAKAFLSRKGEDRPDSCKTAESSIVDIV